MIDSSISDEKINALIDDQLDAEEKARLLQQIGEDKELAQRYFEYRQIDELVKSAFPQAPDGSSSRRIKPSLSVHPMTAVALVAVMFVGGYLGWLIKPTSGFSAATVSIAEISQTAAIRQSRHNILLHISTMNPAHIQKVFAVAEQLLENGKPDRNIEIVANAEGLGVLRPGSPYVGRIQELADRHSNVKFLACGIARQTADLKEGHAIDLIPQATPIPAALDRIIQRIKEGWTYVKG